MEDYGQLPSDLQRRVISEVDRAKERGGMPIRESLKILGGSVWNLLSLEAG